MTAATAAHRVPTANTPSPECLDRRTTAADRIRSPGCPDDTALDPPRTPRRPEQQPVPPCRRHPGSTPPNGGSSRPPSALRTPPPSPPEDVRRANAADRG